MKGNIAQDKVLFSREVLMHLTIQEKVFFKQARPKGKSFNSPTEMAELKNLIFLRPKPKT